MATTRSSSTSKSTGAGGTDSADSAEGAAQQLGESVDATVARIRALNEQDRA